MRTGNIEIAGKKLTPHVMTTAERDALSEVPYGTIVCISPDTNAPLYLQYWSGVQGGWVTLAPEEYTVKTQAFGNPGYLYQTVLAGTGIEIEVTADALTLSTAPEQWSVGARCSLALGSAFPLATWTINGATPLRYTPYTHQVYRSAGTVVSPSFFTESTWTYTNSGGSGVKTFSVQANWNLVSARYSTGVEVWQPLLIHESSAGALLGYQQGAISTSSTTKLSSALGWTVDLAPGDRVYTCMSSPNPLLSGSSYSMEVYFSGTRIK